MALLFSTAGAEETDEPSGGVTATQLDLHEQDGLAVDSQS